jgi:SAM-dependent methyltransferase
MKNKANGKPDYGNWVSRKLIVLPGALGIVLLAMALLAPALFILAALFLGVAAYFVYARHQFAPNGGNVQAQVLDLVLARLDWDGAGEVLDIGCGNGPLTIRLAQKYPNAHAVGIDFWGGQWEYSRDVCERNAQLEGIAERVSFQKASASKLPFVDGCFDAAVSNLVFHEVADAADKREVIREALRVVKKGGKFAFQDLFLLQRVYGDPQELLATIRGWGVSKVEFVETRSAPFIPGALKLPFMVGTIAIIAGEK